ncbi:MAG: hypothetical protein LBM04_09645 [Opitutaceae bacterium]|jgi:hypothetical protein|nr:hypothetical protein [Opitutaceae bacterium]
MKTKRTFPFPRSFAATFPRPFAAAILTFLFASFITRASAQSPAQTAQPQTAQSPPMVAAQIEPTVLFAKKEPLRQIAWLTVMSTAGAPLACDVIIKIDGVPATSSPVTSAPASPLPAQKLTLAPGISRHDVLVPDIEKPCVLEIELRAAGKNTVLTRLRQNWQPQRKWKIHLVKSSHEDIGYEGFLWEKQKEIADFTDFGAHLSRAASATAVAEGATTSGGYRYNLESLLFGRYYIAERGEPAWRKLIAEKIKPGLTPLAGGPNAGVHFHWMDTEEMARLMYPARREYKDRFGLDIPVFLSVDNPSISWAGAQLIAAAGFKYAVRYGQPFRTGKNNDYATTGLPAIFYWKTPDASTRILYTWRGHYGINFFFGETAGGYNDLSDLGAQNIQRQLLPVQNGATLGPYPYDAILVPSYQDHEIPKWDNRALTRWKSLYAYPEIILSDPSAFLSYIEKNFAAEIPTLSGDLNNNSADYASIDPESQGWKRTAARVLPVAETLNTLNTINTLHPAASTPLQPFSPSAFQPFPINRAYTRIFDYDEHSWPTSPRAGDIHRFNAQWGKRLEGRRAFNDASGYLAQTLSALAAAVPTGEKQTLLVFNSSAQPRTGIVTINTKNLLQLADVTAQKPVATQYHPAHRSTVFIAENVPALGYKTFEITGEQPVTATTAAAKPTSAPASTDPVIENKFYKITLDKNSGAITSIIDKELARELVDTKAAHQFNQAVLVSKKTKEGRQGSTYSPKNGALFERGTGGAGGASGAGGPVFNQISATITDKKLGGATLRQSVRLYAALKHIEIINSITHLGILDTARHTDRYKENLFYAFPLAVPGFTHRAEQAVGTVRPHDDQLRFGSHDYLAVNRYLNTGNDDFTVTIAPREASIFHLGAIRYNEFSIDYKPGASHVFSYAWSNRMAGLLALTPDDLRAHLHYTITSSAGPWNNGAATRLGDAVASPLLAIRLPAKQSGHLPPDSASFISIDQPNIRLTVLKHSEQPGRGCILRLVETAGKDTPAKITIKNLSARLNAATLTDLVENDTTPLPLRDGVLTLDIKANTVVTLRLYNDDAPLPAPQNITATAASDSAITLAWDAVPGAAACNIYRSTDPDAPATAATLIAVTPPSPVGPDLASGRERPHAPVTNPGATQGRALQTPPATASAPAPAASALQPFSPSALSPAPRIHFTDTTLNIGTTYHYQIAALAPANSQGAISEKISATTLDKNTTPPPPVTELGIVRLSTTSLMVCWEKSPAPDIARFHVFRSEKSDFSDAREIAIVKPGGYYLEHFTDENLTPGKTYHYRVFPEDWADNRQPDSPAASAKTPR